MASWFLYRPLAGPKFGVSSAAAVREQDIKESAVRMFAGLVRSRHFDMHEGDDDEADGGAKADGLPKEPPEEVSEEEVGG